MQFDNILDKHLVFDFPLFLGSSAGHSRIREYDGSQSLFTIYM